MDIATGFNNVKKWANESFPIDLNIFKEMSSEPIPSHLKKWWFAVGGTPLYLFMVQVITGMILTFYYVPDPANAYESVARITNEVRLGWFFRSLHKLSAHLMIFAILLHMIRVFFTSAYRPPRELNWMLGVGLLLSTMVAGFTGYSLIYEQMSYWAAVVGTNIAEATPLLGGVIADFMRGGPEVGSNTLTRFYIFHVALLPMVIMGLIGFHVVQIRLHGVTRLNFDQKNAAPSVELSIGVSAPVTPMRLEEKEESKGTSKESGADKEGKSDTYPFFPDHFYTELIIGLFLTFLLVIMALSFPAAMGVKANPMVTPDHIKPEWFFFAMFRWLKLTSFQVGVIGTMVFMTVLLLWPFVDRGLEKKFPAKNVSFYIGAGFFVVYVFFTLWEAMV